MTRINLGVPAKELTNKHLIAEHREIKRIPNAIVKGRVNLNKIPSKFTLGTGHVSYFYDKQGYLLDRYRELYAECIARGFKVQNYEASWEGVPAKLMNKYTPTLEDTQIIRNRIADRLANPIAKQKRNGFQENVRTNGEAAAHSVT